MNHDGHIRLLPLHVANKIAAGEVVERPASVLKEILENAIDAGATRLDAVITAGGRKLVALRDNGCGMTREDALLSLERQATSKIRDVDDIERIDTLGFRGEAIPSIAAVSRFTLVTRRPENEEGTRLTVNAGTLAEVATCGAPPGTSIEVRDLFCNVPARRKFLRAFATEESHIRNVFSVHALAHPDLGFSLTLDGREAYRFAAGATLEERIRDLFGAEFAEALVPVSFSATPDAPADGIRIHGYVERPDLNASFRREQYVFINGRPATSPAIAYALKEAYPRRTGDARPAVVIFIDLPPTQVDVNVHPAKREVRFRTPAAVREALIRAISDALTLRDTPVPAGPVPTPPAGPVPTPLAGPVPTPLAGPVPTPLAGPVPTPLAGPVPTPIPFQVPFQPSLPPVETVGSDNGRTERPKDEILNSASGPWRWFNYLAQTESGYLLLETDAGLVTLHPRAACERILYEQLLDSARTISQPLLIPQTVQLSPLESAKIASFRDVLLAEGFQLEEFGSCTWKIDAVPQRLGTEDVSARLASIAHDIAEAGAKRGGVRWREELVARSVARASTGKIARYTPEAARKLVEELAVCRMPYVCPRGKPVMIFTSNREFSRKFDR